MKLTTQKDNTASFIYFSSSSSFFFPLSGSVISVVLKATMIYKEISDSCYLWVSTCLTLVGLRILWWMSKEIRECQCLALLHRCFWLSNSVRNNWWHGIHYFSLSEISFEKEALEDLVSDIYAQPIKSSFTLNYLGGKGKNLSLCCYTCAVFACGNMTLMFEMPGTLCAWWPIPRY